MRRSVFVWLLLVFGVYSDSPVFALTCAPPALDRKSVEQADIIFEGTVISLVPGDSGAEKNGHYTEEALFEVRVPWKGVRKGQKITILRNSYWGDRSAEGSSYLVMSRKETVMEWFGLKRKTVYRAPHCRNTLHVPYTEENIERLKDYFSSSP